MNDIMQQWDYWRKRIADGDVSSGPRDWFESVIEPFDATELEKRAIDTLSTMECRGYIRCLRDLKERGVVEVKHERSI